MSIIENKGLVDEYLDWFVNVKRGSEGTAVGYRGVLYAWCDFLGATPLRAATHEMVEAFMRRPRARRAHGNQGSPSSMVKDKAIISALSKWMIGHNLAAQNPTLIVVTPKVRNIQPRPIDDEMWQQVWDAAEPMDKVWLGLGAIAGLRRAEIVNLECGQVLLENTQLVGFKRKNGGEDTLEYGEIACVISEKLPQVLSNPEDWLDPLRDLVKLRRELSAARVVPLGRGGLPSAHQLQKHGLPEGSADPQVLTRRLRTVLRRAGLHEAAFTPHALRHTAATNLLRAGVPLPIVSNLMNHSSVEVTMRYLKAGGGALREWRMQHQRDT